MTAKRLPPDPPPTLLLDGHEQEPGLRLYEVCVGGCGALGIEAGDGTLAFLFLRSAGGVLDDSLLACLCDVRGEERERGKRGAILRLTVKGKDEDVRAKVHVQHTWFVCRACIGIEVQQIPGRRASTHRRQRAGNWNKTHAAAHSWTSSPSQPTRTGHVRRPWQRQQQQQRWKYQRRRATRRQEAQESS